MITSRLEFDDFKLVESLYKCQGGTQEGTEFLTQYELALHLNKLDDRADNNPGAWNNFSDRINGFTYLLYYIFKHHDINYINYFYKISDMSFRKFALFVQQEEEDLDILTEEKLYKFFPKAYESWKSNYWNSKKQLTLKEYIKKNRKNEPSK